MDDALTVYDEFQSTLPVRGATTIKNTAKSAKSFQSTLPVRGATGGLGGAAGGGAAFQSTLPVRGATHNCGHGRQLHYDFNPRSPCGERRGLGGAAGGGAAFQSTLPVRGATVPPPGLSLSR